MVRRLNTIRADC